MKSRHQAAALALLAAVVTRGVPAEPVIDLGAARQAFAQAAALSRADGGRLWGVPLYGPMLFADPVTRQAVANEDAAGTGLQAVEGLFVATGHHRNGILLTPLTALTVSEAILSGRVPDLIREFTIDRFTGRTSRGADRAAQGRVA